MKKIMKPYSKWNEKDILRALDIPDYRHLSKDKITQFVSMLPDLNPEVAKEVIKQFPEFAKTSIEMIKQIREMSADVNEANKASVEAIHKQIDAVQSALENELSKDITAEEKEYIFDKMLDLVKILQDVDSENKRFLSETHKRMLIASLMVLLPMASILGIRSELAVPKLRWLHN